MMDRRNTFLAALIGACSVGCVPEYGLLDATNSCEQGVETTNPYDFRWTLRIEKARISVEGAQGLPHNPVRFQTYRSEGGSEFEKTDWDRYDTSFDGEYAAVYFDSDVLVRGSLEEILGGDLEEVKSGEATPFRLELWDDGGWLGIGRNSSVAGCDLKLDPAALVNAVNEDAPIIIGNRLVSEPEDSIVLSPETVGCPWLLHAELTVEASLDTTRYQDGEVTIEKSADCSSLNAADAYDYEILIGEVNLDPDNPDLSSNSILYPAPTAVLTYQGRWFDMADLVEDDDYAEYDVRADSTGINPTFYLRAGDFAHGARDEARPGLQIDHLTGDSEHQVHLRIYDATYTGAYEGDYDADKHYEYLDCVFELTEEQILTSVNEKGSVGPRGGEARWIQIGPGNGLNCTGDDRTSQGLIDGDSVAVAFTPHLKWAVTGGTFGDDYFTAINYPQENPEGATGDSLTDVQNADAGPFGYDPDGPDRCVVPGAGAGGPLAYNCSGVCDQPYPYFHCTQGGAIEGDVLEPDETVTTTATATDEEDDKDDEEDVNETEIEEGPSPDDPEECCMADGGCSKGVIPEGDCAEEAADPCAPNPCVNGGNTTATCNEDGEDYTCTCTGDYETNGTTCVLNGEEAAGPCDESNPCGANGKCVPDGEDYTCNCNDGYTDNGTTCAEVGTTCADDPCFTGVECTDVDDTYDCGDCPSGYTGNGEQCILAGDDGGDRPEPDVPNLPDDDDDDSKSDDPTQMAPISGCACNGSDTESSRGTALLILAALVLVWRRRRQASRVTAE